MGSSNSLFGKMLDNVFPRVPPFLSMITVQCEILTSSLNILAGYMGGEVKDAVANIAKQEEAAHALKEKHLDILNNAFSTPIDREDVLRAITTLDIPVGSARVVMEEMEGLKVAADKFSLEMSVMLREAATAIQRGFGKLETNPGSADPDALGALQTLLGIDRVYRKALGSLYTIDEDLKRFAAHTEDAEVKAMQHVVDMMKRREMYRHLRDLGIQLSDAARVLHSIVVQIG
ncbi:MAG: DUF47 family protein [Magnetococcales bacterium]|nr:DUF47 family protein [Magnetococcales bacterium]